MASLCSDLLRRQYSNARDSLTDVGRQIIDYPIENVGYDNDALPKLASDEKPGDTI